MTAAGNYQLAQFNFARARFPTTDPRMKDFVEALIEINQLAERSPGFIWRLQTDAGHSIDVRPFEDDDQKLITLSVWRDLSTLKNFVYKGAHSGFLKRRDLWFEAPRQPYLVLWWIKSFSFPTASEGIARLAHLTRDGVTPEAFDFSAPFNPDGTPYIPATRDNSRTHPIAIRHGDQS
jgi:hypothetical protein